MCTHVKKGCKLQNLLAGISNLHEISLDILNEFDAELIGVKYIFSSTWTDLS